MTPSRTIPPDPSNRHAVSSHGSEHESEFEHELTLVARIRDGDEHAFARLVDIYLERVTRFAAYTVGSRDVAEDVVQSVFVHIWQQRASLDPQLPFKSYLFRAIRNRALDERKAAAVRERYRDYVQAHAGADIRDRVEPSPEDAVLSGATVQTALRELSERRQLAVRLRLEEELSYPEIAEVLGLSVQAAERLVRRAIAELRENLLVSG